MKKYIVTVVDHGRTCDGKARILDEHGFKYYAKPKLAPI